MTSKKGQAGLLGVVFGLIMFFILWSLFLASWVRTAAEDMIVNNSLTGLEAFLIANINLWIFSGILIGVLAVAYIGGRS